MAASSHLVVGIAGGSGSGKTTLSREVVRGLGQGNVTYVSHEFYYRDLSHLPFEERANVKFDHPDALETSLLETHLTKLKAGEPVEMPIYDFAEHTRREKSRSVESMGVIIIEGILIFCHAELRDLMDVKIFVDTKICDVDMILAKLRSCIHSFVKVTSMSGRTNCAHCYCTSFTMVENWVALGRVQR